jgi:hypothetical protein
MATRLTLKVDRDGQLGEVPLHDTEGNEEVPTAKIATLVRGAWTERATEAERKAGGPGDNAALDLVMLGRVSENQLWATYRRQAKAEQPIPEM